MSVRLACRSWLALLAAALLAALPAAAETSGAARVVGSADFMARHAAPAGPLDRHVDEEKIASLVAEMTLREKVGQMTQLEISMVTSGEDAELVLDAEEVATVIGEYGVGSILNVSQQTLPPERWHELIRGLQEAAAGTRLGIPIVYGIDSIHGANYVVGATLFPQPLAMAATWNPELMLEASRITAAETRAAGIPWNFSPVLDVGRQPLWPRLYETFGEDVYVTEVMGVASIAGYQGADAAADDRVAACMKHYVGYSFPTTGHDRTPALIPELMMREIFLPPFQAAVDAGALSLMVNSGEVNGIPGHANRWLLTDVLRGELGFDGVAVSDWEDLKKMVEVHRVASDEKEATKMAINAGVDMSMVPSDLSFADLLVELVEEGAVPMARIDEAVERVLRMKMRLGLFAEPLAGIGNGVEIGSEAAWQTSLAAAREAVTLLKNGAPGADDAAQGSADGAGGAGGTGGTDGAGGAGEVAAPLPLADGVRVLVTGPTCDSRAALNNGWTHTWQGMEELHPEDHPTFVGALVERLGEAAVTHLPGASYDAAVDVAAAAAAAAEADVAIVCLGELAYAETPGNIDDLALPAAQLELARAVAAAGKPTVLVLFEGRPRLIREIADDMAAIVLGYNPGPAGGRAMVDVLFGDVNPSGKLPFTYPRHANALRTYDHKAFEAQDTSFGFTAYRPQYPFGHGLSYTSFEYSDLTVTPDAVGEGGTVEVGVTVRNSGQRRGAEVVHLYVSDLVASVTPPVKRLRGWAKVWLDPGESQRLSFAVGAGELAFIGPDGRPTVEPGEFSVAVGGLSQGFAVGAESGAAERVAAE